MHFIYLLGTFCCLVSLALLLKIAANDVQFLTKKRRTFHNVVMLRDSALHLKRQWYMQLRFTLTMFQTILPNSIPKKCQWSKSC